MLHHKILFKSVFFNSKYLRHDQIYIEKEFQC